MFRGLRVLPNKVKIKKMEHSVKGCSINFFVSVRTLTVLAIKVISVKRVFNFINYTAFKEINKAV